MKTRVLLLEELQPLSRERTMEFDLLSVDLLMIVLTTNSCLMTRLAQDLCMERIIWDIQSLFIFESSGFFSSLGSNAAL